MFDATPIGWLAAALMVATFSCRDPLWMRPLAVLTNLAFVSYGWAGGLAPVLTLHLLLLPINLWRWQQCARRSATGGPARWTARAACLALLVAPGGAHQLITACAD